MCSAHRLSLAQESTKIVSYVWACGPPIDMKIGLSLCCTLKERGRRRSVYTLDEVRPFVSLIGNARLHQSVSRHPPAGRVVAHDGVSPFRVRSAASAPGGSDEDRGD